MFQRGANVGLKRPFGAITDFSVGGPTALDHMQPALDRQFGAALESAEEKVPEPRVKVGRLLETTIVKESLNQQPKELIYDTVADHFEKRLHYDPYTSK